MVVVLVAVTLPADGRAQGFGDVLLGVARAMDSYNGARGLARGGLSGARRSPLHTAANVSRIFGNHETAGYLDATHHVLRGNHRDALLSFARGAILGNASYGSNTNTSSSRRHGYSSSSSSRSRRRSGHVPRGGLAAVAQNASQTRTALGGLRRATDVSLSKQAEGDVGLVTASMKRGSRQLTYLFAVPATALERVSSAGDLVQLQRSGEKVALLNTELLGNGGRTYVSRSADGARVRARLVRPRGKVGDRSYVSVKTHGAGGELEGKALVEVRRGGWNSMNVWKPRRSDGKMVKQRDDVWAPAGPKPELSPKTAGLYRRLGSQVAAVRPAEKTNIKSHVYAYDPYDGTSPYMHSHDGPKPAGYTVERYNGKIKLQRPPAQPKLAHVVTNLRHSSREVRQHAMWQLRELASAVRYGQKEMPALDKARPALRQLASAGSEIGQDARYTLKTIDKAQRRFSGNTFWRKLVRRLTPGSGAKAH
jgi:hypothetical protein